MGVRGGDTQKALGQLPPPLPSRGWNGAGRWRDSSVRRFKFRPDQTRRLGPSPSQPDGEELVGAIADHIIISPHLPGGTGLWWGGLGGTATQLQLGLLIHEKVFGGLKALFHSVCVCVCERVQR